MKPTFITLFVSSLLVTFSVIIKAQQANDFRKVYIDPLVNDGSTVSSFTVSNGSTSYSKSPMSEDPVPFVYFVQGPSIVYDSSILIGNEKALVNVTGDFNLVRGTPTDPASPCNFNAANIALTVDSTIEIECSLGDSLKRKGYYCDFDNDGVMNSYDLDDNDGDGVMDVYDIDDDNDGILDKIESPCTSGVEFDFESDNGGWSKIFHTTEKTATVSTDKAYTCLVSKIAASPSGNYLVTFDEAFYRSYFSSPASMNLNVSGAIGKELSFYWINGRMDGLGEQDAEYTNLEVRLTGGGQTVKTTYNAKDLHNKGWIYIQIPLTTTLFGANLSTVLGDLDEIRIEVETFYGQIENKCQVVDEYIGLDAVRLGCVGFLDTDKDGIPNDKDLDSDGDGCPDAVEAGTYNKSGVTTKSGDLENGRGGVVTSTTPHANAAIAGPYGNNGFANSLQATADTNTYKGTYTYADALDSTKSICCRAGSTAPTLSTTTLKKCAAETANLNSLVTSTAPAGTKVVWYTNNTHTDPSVPDPTSVDIGTYHAYYYDTVYNCFSPASSAVAVSNHPAPVGSASAQTICFGETTSIVLNSTTSGTGYSWTASQLSGKSSGQANGRGDTIAQKITNATSSDAVVRYTVTPAANGCSGSAFTVDATVKPALGLTINDIPKQCIKGGLVELKATPAGGAWSGEGVSGTKFSPAVAYTGTHAIKYQLTSNGCTDSAKILIHVTDCPDFDRDRIPDIDDIDDDNDGVLDKIESLCDTINITKINLTEARSVGPYPPGNWLGQYSFDMYEASITAPFKFVNYVEIISHDGDSDDKYVSSTPNFLSVDFYYPNGSKKEVHEVGIFADPDSSVTAGSVHVIALDTNNIIIYEAKGLKDAEEYKVDGSKTSGKKIHRLLVRNEITNNTAFEMLSFMPGLLNCTDLDQDRDGVPNRLDLDTDGDGCPDAVEAGTYNKPGVTTTSGSLENGTGGSVTSTTPHANAVIAGPYDANGFANILRKASPDTNQYNYTYTYNLAVDGQKSINCFPPPTKDTVKVRLPCPSCFVTACPVINDIDTSGGGITYTTCRPNSKIGYTISQDPKTGCLKITSTKVIVHTDTTCTATCKDNRCDTTIVIIYPPVSCPNDTNVCINAAVINLAELKGGGTWSGNGVTGNRFNPADAGKGLHLITYRYTDTSGTPGTCTFNINVGDTVKPTIVKCADAKTVDATEGCSAKVPDFTKDVTGTDNCSSITISQSPAAGSIVPTGKTPVVITVSDAFGNVTRCTTSVTVRDLQKPVISCPKDIVVNAENPGCKVKFTIPELVYTDNCRVVRLLWKMTGATVANSPDTGINQVEGNFEFGSGTTTITYYVYDSSANVDSCSLTITVNKPTIQGTITGNRTVQLNSTPEPKVTFDATGGTAPYIYTYTINRGADSMITGNSGATVSQPTNKLDTFVYRLTKVQDSKGCTVEYAGAKATIIIKEVPPVSDLTPVLALLPTVVHGVVSTVGVLRIDEVGAVSTTGDIVVFITKDSKVTLKYDSTATRIDSVNVGNKDWKLDVTANLAFYKFETKRTMSPKESTSFGFRMDVNAGQSIGALQISATIQSLSGGEVNVANNTDTELIVYFIK